MTMTELEFLFSELEEPVIPCQFCGNSCGDKADWAFIYSPCDECGDTETFMFCNSHKDEMLEIAGQNSKEFSCMDLKCHGTAFLLRIEKI